MARRCRCWVASGNFKGAKEALTGTFANCFVDKREAAAAVANPYDMIYDA